MNPLLKWVLVAVVAAVGVGLLAVERAEAARVWVGYGYYAPYPPPYVVYGYPAPVWYRAYYLPPPPPVFVAPPVRAYRPALVLPPPPPLPCPCP